MLTKVCTCCKIEKNIDEYHRSKSGKYGVKAECNLCRKKWNEANRKAKSEYNRVYQKANKESISAYYQANRVVKLEYSRAYRKVNKDKIAEYASAYQKANPHIINAITAKRKSSKLQATPAWADLKAIKGVYELAVIFNRTGMNLHVDHIVPLQSDLVCGLHCEANLQLLPASDNISKGNRHWPDM
jgi:hypothetical protein